MNIYEIDNDFSLENDHGDHLYRDMILFYSYASRGQFGWTVFHMQQLCSHWWNVRRSFVPCSSYFRSFFAFFLSFSLFFVHGYIFIYVLTHVCAIVARYDTRVHVVNFSVMRTNFFRNYNCCIYYYYEVAYCNVCGACRELFSIIV